MATDDLLSLGGYWHCNQRVYTTCSGGGAGMATGDLPHVVGGAGMATDDLPHIVGHGK